MNRLINSIHPGRLRLVIRSQCTSETGSISRVGCINSLRKGVPISEDCYFITLLAGRERQVNSDSRVHRQRNVGTARYVTYHVINA